LSGSASIAFARKVRARSPSCFGSDIWDTCNGQLAGAGAEQEAARADVVAQVQQLVQREQVFANIVLAHIELHALARLLQLRKAGLALDADGHNAPGDGDLDLLARCQLRLELLGRHRVVRGAQFGNGVGDSVMVGIGGRGVTQPSLLAQRGDLAQLLAALVVKPLFKLRFVHLLLQLAMTRLLPRPRF
jgi:hypothetical protein